jgi:flagella basal body P-ring formation protein FlgA
MRATVLLIALAALTPAACIPVSSPRVVAADLAGAVPLFAALDPATRLGFAPLPGSERILSAAELALMLRQHGVESSGSAIREVCVERVVRPIWRPDMEQALASALNQAGADIEIIDFSRQPFPPGHLEFHREGLNKPPRAAPDTPVIWRGKLIYDEQSSTPVWAKVRIRVERPWFVAAEDISAGAMIDAGQVQITTGRQFPDLVPSLSSMDAIIGKVARRNILKGERLAPGLIIDPADVQKGDRVHVRVLDGLACLSLDALAQSSGKKGDTIVIHNPSSGRNFRAVVEQKGHVMVRSDSGGVN